MGARFAHNSERQFAKLLDFYGIAWEYEPRTFTLEWDRQGRPAQAFSPDFYLPAYDLFIEITTLNQKLVTKKNRKVRRLKELHPDVNVKIFYQRDYLNLLVKYGLEEPSQLSGLDLSEPKPLDFGPDPVHLGSTPVDKRSPLDAAHRALGAKLVPFGGWEMPLAYGSGTIAEHLACREDAVAFDVSHLGTVLVEGPDAFDGLQDNLTNDLRKVAPGRAQYTHLLDEADASVLDDIIVWWVDDEVFQVMPNASNTDRVVGAIGGRDVTAERAVIAVQGPQARRRLESVAPEAAAVGRFRVTRFDWKGSTITAAGTGYTGEDGVECAVPLEVAEAFWDAVLGAGVTPAGLGARDTLRLEAGLPLHGHELGAGITPLQAGLGWVVGWDKPGGFRGRDALAAERDGGGPARKLAGIVVEGRQPPREGYPVSVDGEVAGAVTSGNFSPVLGTGIALAFLPPAVEPGAAVEVEARGKRLAGQVVKLPFVSKKG